MQAIDGLGVGVAVTRLEVRVQDRHVRFVIEVETKPGADLQLVSDVDGVLSEARIGPVGAVERGVIRVAADRVLVVQARGAAGGEVGQRVKVVDAVRGRNEHVEHVGLAGLGADLETVAAPAVVGDGLVAGFLFVQRVGVAELVGPETHAREAAGAAGRRGVDGDLGRGTDLDVRIDLSGVGGLSVAIVAIGALQRGRKVVGPVGVDFEGGRLVAVELLIPVRTQRRRGGAHVGAQIGAGFSVAIGQAGAVAIADVPIELGRVLLVGDRTGRVDVFQ